MYRSTRQHWRLSVSIAPALLINVVMPGIGIRADDIPAADRSAPAENAPINAVEPVADPGEPENAFAAGEAATRIPFEMREAERLLHAGDFAAAQAQQQLVLTHLDELLAELNSADANGGANAQVSAAGASSASSAGSRQGGAGDSSAARESSAEARPGRAADVNVERRTNLATSVWGHLPDRMREQMRQSYRERFLPEYEEQIEAYYKRLAEQEFPELPASGKVPSP